MKKKIIITVIICILTGMLASCGKNREAAVNTVNEYWQAVKQGDLGELAKYADEDARKIINSPVQYISDYSDGLILSLSGIIDEDRLKSMLDESMGMVLDKVEYTVGEARKEGEDIIVNCTANLPDTNISFSDGIDALLKVAGVKDQQELLEKFLESKGLTIENAAASYANNQSVMESDFAKWLIDNYMNDFVAEMISGMTFTQKSWDFVVEEDDGRWLIDEIREK